MRVHNLKELVVESETAWIEGEKAVFIPSKRDKKLSHNIPSLLEQMQLPTLITMDGNIKSITGKSISYFINGVRADEVDMATFWPKDALRVEYFENPSDPKYEGAECVVNFVMRKYVVGGVAKLFGYQTFRNSGWYDASTKLDYKKMSFGVMVGGQYSRDHLTTSLGTERYKNLYYDGMHYDKIESSITESSFNRNDNVDAAVNARYVSDKTTVTHTLGLKWQRDPGSGFDNKLIWNPSLFSNGQAFSENKSNSLSPQIKGRYTFTLSPSFSLNAGWTYSHSHNNSNYVYSQDLESPIENSTMEDVNSMEAYGMLSCNKSRRFRMYIQGLTSMDWYKIQYGGSSDKLSKQHRGQTTGIISAYWSPTSNFVIDFKPGVNINYWKVGDFDNYTNVSPRADLTLGWFPSNKFYLYGFLSYFKNTPSASASSDVTVKQTELIWYAGNPLLKKGESYRPSLSATWLPNKWLQGSLSVRYDKMINTIYSVFKTASKEMGGLIRQDINGADFDSYGVDLIVGVKLFNNQLNLNLQPTYRYYKSFGEYAQQFGWFRMRGVLSGYIGDVKLALVYGGGEKYMRDCGSLVEKTSDSWDFDVSYGTGDWYFSVRVDDIFHNHSSKEVRANYGCYEVSKTMQLNGRKLKVMVSYTFGYGRKVSNNIDIDNLEDIKTGAVGAKF